MLLLLLPHSQPCHPNNKTYQHIPTYLPPPTIMHLLQQTELLPTPLRQMPHGHFPEFSTCPNLILHLMTFVFPIFTLRPFSSIPFFQHLIFSTTFSSDSAIRARSSAYSNSHGKPSLNSFDNASNTMMNNSGLRTEP